MFQYVYKKKFWYVKNTLLRYTFKHLYGLYKSIIGGVQVNWKDIL
jgi:hypothetical protein